MTRHAPPVLLLAALLLSSAAGARELWRADFEEGLGPWTKVERVAVHRLQTVDTPVREGRRALRVEVRQGDDPIGASGHRAELVHVDGAPDGSERVYAWSTLFPSTFPRARTWQLFAQWHHTGLTGSPPVELFAYGDELRLRVGGERGRVLWRGPMRPGTWHDFALRVRWSADPGEGFVELFHGGERVLPLTRVATRYPGQGTYLKLGLYRDARVEETGVVFHDGVRVATRLEDVLPREERAQRPRGPTPEEALAQALDTLLRRL
jgi:hypothetical protein